LSDVVIDGTPRPEYRRVPFDAIVRANDDERLGRALVAAPVGFVFEREVGDGPVPIEPRLRRRFATVASEEFDVSGIIGGLSASAADSDTSGACVDRGLRVDGVALPLRVAERLADGRVRVEGCGPVVVPAGDHFLDQAGGFVVDQLMLLPKEFTSDGFSVPFDPRSVASSPVEGGRMVLRVRSMDGVDAPAGPVMVTIGRGFHRGWKVTGSSRLVSAADTQTAIVVAADSTVTLEFTPQRSFRVFFALMMVTLAACVVLIVQPWRWRGVGHRTERPGLLSRRKVPRRKVPGKRVSRRNVTRKKAAG
jgi:hypothetical protein